MRKLAKWLSGRGMLVPRESDKDSICPEHGIGQVSKNTWQVRFFLGGRLWLFTQPSRFAAAMLHDCLAVDFAGFRQRKTKLNTSTERVQEEISSNEDLTLFLSMFRVIVEREIKLKPRTETRKRAAGSEILEVLLRIESLLRSKLL